MTTAGTNTQEKDDFFAKELDPQDLEIIAKQATVNIVTAGHVAHGKSTLVAALSKTNPVRFKEEKERNCTIHLGYANAKIYKCDICPRPSCYHALPSHEKKNTMPCLNNGCQGKMTLVRHVSFVDSPGHHTLMATMLNGAAVADSAMLIIAADQECPQPQTLEHLVALEIMQLPSMLVIQNKVDLLQQSKVMESHSNIKNLVEGTVAENAPILPISAIHKLNLDVLCEYICTKIPHPIRDLTSRVRMVIVRSFDINKPGELNNIRKDLKGGVAGGTIIQGILREGDEIELRPGLIKKINDKFECTPIYTRVTSLFAEKNCLKFAVPGGLIGVGTLLDPCLTKRDRLKGQVIGHKDSLPDVFTDLEISYTLLKRVLGLEKGAEKIKIKKLVKDERLSINIGSIGTQASVIAVKADLAKLKLYKPVCTPLGEKMAISRKISGTWRLIGWGQIHSGSFN